MLHDIRTLGRSCVPVIAFGAILCTYSPGSSQYICRWQKIGKYTLPCIIQMDIKHYSLNYLNITWKTVISIQTSFQYIKFSVFIWTLLTESFHFRDKSKYQSFLVFQKLIYCMVEIYQLEDYKNYWTTNFRAVFSLSHSSCKNLGYKTVKLFGMQWAFLCDKNLKSEAWNISIHHPDPSQSIKLINCIDYKAEIWTDCMV